MEDATVLNLLDKLSFSKSLQKFLQAIRKPPESQRIAKPEDTESGNACDKEMDPPSDNNIEWLDSQVVADEHQLEHASLGTDVSCQSRGDSRLIANRHQSTAT